MLKTIGGDRLGSGNKMKTRLHNYERSNHNLGNVFRTTLSVGTLVPFYKKIALNGDSWTINLRSMLRTMPAIGPLFGTYKLQLDMFLCPIRLYNGLLHGNWVKIGLDMSKVKLPKVRMRSKWINPTRVSIPNFDQYQISSSSLMAYMGVRGIGGASPLHSYTQEVDILRDFNAVPFLAYYDIFKQYYSNKQEKLAYVIKGDCSESESATITISSNATLYGIGNGQTIYPGTINALSANEQATLSNTYIWKPTTYDNLMNSFQRLYIFYDATFVIKIDGVINTASNEPIFIVENENGLVGYFNPITDLTNFESRYDEGSNSYIIRYKGTISASDGNYISGIAFTPVTEEKGTIKLQEFDLENIDRMREHILRNTGLNNEVIINDLDAYPYKSLYEVTPAGNSMSRYKQVGLMLKTYQSDLYNNWLSTEFIDGVNGIAAVTAVDTTQGSFTMDTLNLAQKVYNMLNRIAISGGTYQDWQEAVYGEDAVRMVESPMYLGGMSATIAFEEVVSTADTETQNAGDQPLGSLAGKGTIADTRGGHIEIKVKEPSYIIGIASITPYIDYAQGNDFDMFELDSVNDLHKPALDGIGFQNLMLEQAVWWGTEYDQANDRWIHNAAGKVPAWINYMTSVNQVYGDFAERNNLGFMTLTRRYEYGQGLLNGTNQIIPVKDWTTYINPTKYNYQFAVTDLEAQNFWLQVGIDAFCRRKISAKVIPNL